MTGIKKNILTISVVGIAFLIIFAYWNSFYSFFQQDEWLGFAFFLHGQNNGFLNIFFDSVFLSNTSHVTPLSIAFLYAQFNFFVLNFTFYALVGIVNHILNTFLVLILAYRLLKNKYLAISAGLLFGLSSISSQSVTWIATSVNTLPATTFVILSLLSFQRYIEGVKNKNKYLYAALGMILVALLFKETAIFLFLFFIPYWFFFKKDSNIKDARKLILTLFIIGFLYISVRAVFLFIGNNISQSTTNSAITPDYITYIFRLFSFSLKIISQSIIPASILLFISRGLVFIAYPQYFVYSDKTVNPYVAESIAYDFVSYFLSFLILVLAYAVFIFLSKRQRMIAQTILFSLLLICLSSLPFIFLGGTEGYFSIFAPRHLYIATIGASLFIVIFLHGVTLRFINDERIKKLGIIVCVVVLGIAGMKIIREDTRKTLIESNTRKDIIVNIYKKYPSLPEKTIFYIESDSAFYGLPPEEKIPPFQSGFGQTLLVWYRANGSFIPSCFFQDTFLYAIESQGYRECEERGFGYFRKFSDLKEATHQFNIDPKDVIAFRYLSQENKLEDISKIVKRKLITEKLSK